MISESSISEEKKIKSSAFNKWKKFYKIGGLPQHILTIAANLRSPQTTTHGWLQIDTKRKHNEDLKDIYKAFGKLSFVVVFLNPSHSPVPTKNSFCPKNINFVKSNLFCSLVYY